MKSRHETPSDRAVRFERRVKLGFFFASLVALFLLIFMVQNLLVSFILAISTYYFLAPAVDFFERRGTSRLTATIIPFLSLTVLLLTAMIIFSPDLLNQIETLKQNFPKYQFAMTELIKLLESQTNGIINFIEPLQIQAKVDAQLLNISAAVFQEGPGYVSRSFAVLLLAPFLCFFMLLNGREFMRGLINMVPNSLLELGLNLSNQISSQIGGFIRARLIESVIVGLLLWIGLEALDFPYSLILAIFAASLNIIPYLGPVIGVVPPLIVCVANGANHSTMIFVLLLFLAVQVIDTVVLVPFMVARIVNLHPVVVVLTVLLGAQLMGVIGMIICIPVAAALKVTSQALYRHFTDFRT